jgi:deoxycytidine triphosphate deaminase
MGFLSNYDIKYLLKNGDLKIEPKPKIIGSMSVDLAIKDVFSPSVDQLEKIFPFIKDPTINIDDFFMEGRTVFKIDSLDLKPLPNVHEWHLQRECPYIVRHREEFRSLGLIGFNIYTRSGHARKGIHSLGFGHDGKYLYEILAPIITQRLSKLDRISQLIFVEPGTNYLSKSEIEEAVSGNHIIVTKDGKKVKEVEEYPKVKLGFIPLTLADEVKYYPPDYLEQLYSPERFVDGRLSSHSIPTGSFVLGISNERVDICNEYVGALPHHVHKNLSLKELKTVECEKHHAIGIFHSSSPFHQPGSDGRMVFEIPDYDPYVISAGMYVPLRIGKMTTPSSAYHGKFLNQSNICL